MQSAACGAGVWAAARNAWTCACSLSERNAIDSSSPAATRRNAFSRHKPPLCCGLRARRTWAAARRADGAPSTSSPRRIASSRTSSAVRSASATALVARSSSLDPRSAAATVTSRASADARAVVANAVNSAPATRTPSIAPCSRSSVHDRTSSSVRVRLVRSSSQRPHRKDASRKLSSMRSLKGAVTYVRAVSPSVDLDLAALDPIGAVGVRLHVGTPDHDAAVATQRNRRAAALQYDFVLCRHADAPAVHVGFDDGCDPRCITGGCLLDALDETPHDRPRPIAILELDDDLLLECDRCLDAIARGTDGKPGIHAHASGQRDLRRAVRQQRCDGAELNGASIESAFGHTGRRGHGFLGAHESPRSLCGEYEDSTPPSWTCQGPSGSGTGTASTRCGTKRRSPARRRAGSLAPGSCRFRRGTRFRAHWRPPDSRCQAGSSRCRNRR